MLDPVLLADLERVDADLDRELVHQPLDGVRRLGPAGAAVGVGPGLVREHRLAAEVVGRELVDRVEHERAEHRHAAADDADVGAQVGEQLDLEPGDACRPSSALRVSFCHWSRPWWAVISDSERVSVYFTGLPSLRATANVIISSGRVLQLAAEAAAHVGRDHPDLRLRHAGRRPPSRTAGCAGSGSPLHMVICSPVGSTTVERGSMKAGISRCWRYSRSITMPSPRAFSIASSTLPPVPASASRTPSRRDLVGAEVGVGEHGVRSPPPSGRARPAARRTRRRRARRRRGPRPPCGPRRRRRSRRRRRPGRPASARCGGVTWSGVIAQALMHAPWPSPRSAPVKTATTLGACLGRLGVDADDLRVREGAADHGEVQHPGQGEVVGPAGAAGDQPLVLLAAAVRADLEVGLARSSVAVMALASLGAAGGVHARPCTMLW